MASYSQIAAERVRAVDELEKCVMNPTDESALQELITRAPWLIDPVWTVITKNQSLKTFKAQFENFYKERNPGESITLSIEYSGKRPDFILVSLGHKLHLVEIKAPKHRLDDADATRLINYLEAFDAFFEEHTSPNQEFPLGYQVDLIVDGENLKNASNRRSLVAAKKDGQVRIVKWHDFLANTKKAHEKFLEIHDKAAKAAATKRHGN